MKSPASPALSLGVNSTSTQPSAAALLPSTSGLWQREYAPPRGITMSNGQEQSSASMDGSPYPSGSRVYQSLQRPKLLRGAEWQLSVTNNLAAAACGVFAVITWNWRLGVCAAILAWPVQWALRAMGKRDPQYTEVYWRALRHPLRREAHGMCIPRQGVQGPM